MTPDEARAFLRDNHQAVLATFRRDGRPQLSPVGAGIDDEGRVEISSRETAMKVKNLRRDPRASLLVQASSGWTYVVLEGDMTLTEVTTSPDDATSDELVDVYRAVAGKDHPDWDEYRAAMIADKRLVGRLQVTHSYGLPSR